jgi:hypothetical protein
MLTASLRTRWLHNFAMWGVDTALAWLTEPAAGLAAALLSAERGWGLPQFFHTPGWVK